jgi:hypothetical protein
MAHVRTHRRGKNQVSAALADRETRNPCEHHARKQRDAHPKGLWSPESRLDVAHVLFQRGTAGNAMEKSGCALE